MDYQPSSLTGPLTDQALQEAQKLLAEKNPALVFDPDYLEHERRFHGGIPVQAWIQEAGGAWIRVIRFLNLGGVYDPPFQESGVHLGADLRTDYGLPFIASQPNIVSQCLPFFLPIALAAAQPPYAEADDCYESDLICLDSRADPRKASVVVWINRKAAAEFERCSKPEPGVPDGAPLPQPDPARFSEKLADSFQGFLAALRDAPAAG